MITSTAATPREHPSGTRPDHRRRRSVLLAVLAVVLVVATGHAVFYRMSDSFGDAASRSVHFEAAAMDPAVIRGYLLENGMAGRVRAVVVHFRDASCPCSTLGDARFLALRARHVGEDVVFATAEAPRGSSDPVRGLERFPRLPPEAAARLWSALPAAPAVAVFDGRGTPLFLGPYAEGEHCSAAHGGRAEAALANIGAAPVPMPPGEAAGCVCDTAVRRSGAIDPVPAAGRTPRVPSVTLPPVEGGGV
jgi:hypothetical protein